MPSYGKFLKDVLSKKRRWVEHETVNLTESCSAIIQKKLSAKLKDPGSFTISCIVGDSQVGKAICDLGASINLMPFSFFQKLKIGTLRPTTITFQMADRTVSYPRGIVEDILVKVNDFIFPVDFVVLDMEEDRNIPLILGRPFLATGRALIDVQKGELTLRLNEESVTFSIYKAMQKHEDEDAWRMEHCNMIEVTDDCVRGVARAISPQDQLERCLSQSIFSPDGVQVSEHMDELLHFVGALNSGVEIPRRHNNFLPLRDPVDEEEKEEKKEELKSLPSHLKYAFLGKNDTYPVIVSSSLTSTELDKQPESNRKKRSRSRGNASTADYMKDIAEGMSNIQLGQAQQDSRWDQQQQWHEEELQWRVQQDSRWDLYDTHYQETLQWRARQEELQQAQWAQLQQLQAQNDSRWTQQQQWMAQQDSRWEEHQAFMQAFYARHPPPSSD